MERIFEFDEWCKVRGVDIETLKGEKWLSARKNYNLYKIKADKLKQLEANKIVHK